MTKGGEVAQTLRSCLLRKGPSFPLRGHAGAMRCFFEAGLCAEVFLEEAIAATGAAREGGSTA